VQEDLGSSLKSDINVLFNLLLFLIICMSMMNDNIVLKL